MDIYDLSNLTETDIIILCKINYFKKCRIHVDMILEDKNYKSLYKIFFINKVLNSLRK